MNNSSNLSRRRALQAGLGLVAGVAAGKLQAVPVTPAVAEGPFFPKRDQRDKDADLTQIEGHEGRSEGKVIDVKCRVVDEAGFPVAGALVDLWQANVHGRYDHEDDPNPAPLDPGFQGWAQLKSDAEGRVSIRTIRPGAYPVEAGWTRPPHLHFKVAKRGYRELVTQMFFAGDELNAVDRLLNELSAEQQRQVLVDFQGRDGEIPVGEFTMVVAKIARA